MTTQTRTPRRSTFPLAAALLALAFFGAGRADAASVRLRWMAADDPDVVSYNVYVRVAGTTYGAPVRGVLPSQESDGSLTYVVTTASDGLTRYFAVSASTATGTEGPLSNERALGTVNPCVLDECSAPTQCEFTPLPQGASCSGGSDPCSATCVDRDCRAAQRVDLAIRRLRFVQRNDGLRVSLRASFTPSGTIDPERYGLSFELSDTAGAPVYRGGVPPGGLRGIRSGTSFQLVDSAVGNGLRRLHLRNRRGSLQINLRGTLATDTLPSSPFTLSISIGTDCARDMDVTCTSGNNALGCR